MNRRGLVDKKNNVKENDKGKEKVEIRDQMKKTWAKKSDNYAGSGSAPNFSVGT